MIRFSAGLVVVALGVLIGGSVTSKLSLVYVSIAISVLALIAWGIGVFLKRGELREELFGDRSGLAPAGAGASAELPASSRSVSPAQSPDTVPTSPVTANPVPANPVPASSVPAAGQDRPAYGQRDGGFNAAAFSPGTQVSSGNQARPTWIPKESAPKDEEPKRDRATAPVGGWGSTSTPPSGTPPVAPRGWDGAKDTRRPSAPPSVPGPSVGATSADTGSTGVPRSWFDRPSVKAEPPAQPAGKAPATPAAKAPAAPADKARAPRPADTVATVAMPAAPAMPATPATAAGKKAAPPDDDPSADTAPVANTSGDVDVPADEDDDWPTRYSWLDDEETDEATESDDALKSDDAMESVLAAGELAKPSADASKASGTSKSAANASGTSKSAANASGTSKSAASKPTEAKPAEAKPTEAKPAEAKFPETKTPENSKSPATEADAKDAGTKRATAKGPAAKAADAADAADATQAVTKADTADADADAVTADANAESADAATAQPESPAAAEDDEPSTGSETAGEGKPAAGQPASGTKMVAVIPGVPRYHEPDCILIRFMPESDVQTRSIPEAKAANCTPCVACQPED